jgi:WD40 repeat protein
MCKVIVILLCVCICVIGYRTVRLWDVNDEGKKQRHVIKPRSQQGRRVVPTACTYSHDGRWIVAACQDGSIQIWDHNRPFV